MLAALSLAMCSTKAMRGRRRTAGDVLSGFSVTGVALVFWSCSWTWSRHTERDSLSVGRWHWSLNRTEDTHWGRNVPTTVPASQVTKRAVLWALNSLLEESAVQRWLVSSRVWGSPLCWCWHAIQGRHTPSWVSPRSSTICWKQKQTCLGSSTAEGLPFDGTRWWACRDGKTMISCLKRWGPDAYGGCLPEEVVNWC